MNQLRFNSGLRLFVVAALIPFSFIACKKDDDSTPAKSNLTVVHASPNAQGVDVYVGDTKANVSTLSYSNSPTATSNVTSFELNAGTQKLKVTPAGNTAPLIELSQNLEGNKDYSLFVINSSTNPGISTIKSLFLTDDFKAPAAGKGKVRFIHLSPDGPAVDITAVNGSVSNRIFENKAYESASDFIELDANTYNLEVRKAGTADKVTTLPPLPLMAGKIYTIIAKGFVQPPSGNSNTLNVQIIEHQARK